MVDSEKFINQLRTHGANAFIALFDQIPDVLFWLKDCQLRIVALNDAFAECVNLTKAQIIGSTDADLYFPELARGFMEDDRRVMRLGEPMCRKVELLANRFGGIEWRSTTKLPVRDDSGRVVGTAGVSRPLAGADQSLPPSYRALRRIIEHCREQLPCGINVEQMAHYAGLSVATLSRRFRQHLRLTPGELLSHLRLSRACRLLSDSPLNVTEIALECGYESPAAFSRAFRRQMRMPPLRYRSMSPPMGATLSQHDRAGKRCAATA